MLNILSNHSNQFILFYVILQLFQVDDVGEFKRSWLLPVLKDSISHSTLKCFIDHFLPLALKCRYVLTLFILTFFSTIFYYYLFIYFSEMYEHALKANDKIAGISYDLLESQIWSLLTSFCSNPSDISLSFQVRIIKVVSFLFFQNVFSNFFYGIFIKLLLIKYSYNIYN